MGSTTKKSKQTYTPPSWVEDASKDAIALGRKIGSREYTAYTGERIAGLSENERKGIALANTAAGGWQPYLDKASAALERAAVPFTGANIDAYMNPYIKGALDPAARELREQGALTMNNLRSTQSQRNAFGGARGALLEAEASKNLDQGISDLYAKGHAAAFEDAANRWAQDRDAAFRESSGYQIQANLFRDATTADIQALMQTGAVDRSIQQAMKDFDYQQFLEERNWDVTNLAGLLSAIQGTQGSYSTTTTTKEKTSGGGFSQVLGLVAMAAGAMMTGGVSLAAVGPALASGGAAMAGGALSDQGGESYLGGATDPSAGWGGPRGT